MNFVYICCLVSLLLIIFLKFFSFIISENVSLSREELSSYECGFEHHSLSRIPFSLRYFLLTLVFLLFDLEIVLMLFLPFSFFSSSFMILVLILIFFLFVLFFSLMFEWNDGSLEWLS